MPLYMLPSLSSIELPSSSYRAWAPPPTGYDPSALPYAEDSTFTCLIPFKKRLWVYAIPSFITWGHGWQAAKGHLYHLFFRTRISCLSRGGSGRPWKDHPIYPLLGSSRHPSLTTSYGLHSYTASYYRLTIRVVTGKPLLSTRRTAVL